MATSSSAPGTTTSPSTSTSTGSMRWYAALIGLASLVILLQAVWAGLFIQEGEDYKDNWVEVHARGADVAIGLSVIAAVLVLVRLRAHTDLLAGTLAMAVLLVVEAYIGGLIGDHSKLTVVHFPLGMALMGLSVWLPVRASLALRGARRRA